MRLLGEVKLKVRGLAELLKNIAARNEPELVGYSTPMLPLHLGFFG